MRKFSFPIRSGKNSPWFFGAMLILVLHAPASFGEISVSGQVLDTNSHPVANARVRWKTTAGKSGSTTTDAAGAFSVQFDSDSIYLDMIAEMDNLYRPAYLYHSMIGESTSNINLYVFPAYKLIDVASLAGNFPPNSRLTALNTSGQSCGNATNLLNLPFFWSGSGPPEMIPMGNSSSRRCIGISNSAVTVEVDNIQKRAFRWVPGYGDPVDITPPADPVSGFISLYQVDAINSTGAVVGSGAFGQTAKNTTITHAIAWSYDWPEQIMDLGTLGGQTAIAYGINDSSTMVGEAALANGQTHAFYYTAGKMTDLKTLGGDSSSAYGIDANNNVTGAAKTSSADLHAFLFSGTKMIDLGTFGGGSSSLGAAISYLYDPNHLQIIGWALDKSLNKIEVIWDIDRSSGIFFTTAVRKLMSSQYANSDLNLTAINSSGMIAGQYTDPKITKGKAHAMMLQ